MVSESRERKSSRRQRQRQKQLAISEFRRASVSKRGKVLSFFYMEMISHYHANKTHSHKKGCALSLILKVSVFGTLKWPIGLVSKITALHVHHAF